jgi:hypothetical protein
MDWVELAEDRKMRMAVVSKVINFRFRKVLGHSWVDAQLAASQEVLNSMELVI